MPRKTLSELQAMLAAEKMDALAAVRASKLSAERTRATDYYMGDMSADMPAQDGRSRAVSTDVADTIEGLMPSLMEIFAGSDDVVPFDSVRPVTPDARSALDMLDVALDLRIPPDACHKAPLRGGVAQNPRRSAAANDRACGNRTEAGK